MFGKTFLLEYLSSLIIALLLQTASASQNLQCNPSACGGIRNISYPFRLRKDPDHCGDSSYELDCENNTALLYLNSHHKYHVQAIHYNNFTIHLVDAALKNDTNSFPQDSLSEYPFTRNYPYSIYNNFTGSGKWKKLTTSITFLSCPNPMNSSLFLENAKGVYASNDSYSSTRRYAYVKVGDLNASDVGDMCSIDLVSMTSWPFKNVSNISFSEIHDSLLYGFDLSWFTVEIIDCRDSKFCTLGCMKNVTYCGSPPLSVELERHLRRKHLCRDKELWAIQELANGGNTCMFNCFSLRKRKSDRLLHNLRGNSLHLLRRSIEDHWNPLCVWITHL